MLPTQAKRAACFQAERADARSFGGASHAPRAGICARLPLGCRGRGILVRWDAIDRHAIDESDPGILVLDRDAVRLEPVAIARMDLGSGPAGQIHFTTVGPHLLNAYG
jgi:hypothetical protein